MQNIFRKFAKIVSEIVGSSKAFAIALVFIVVWGISGFFFDFSDSWQLIINTGTTILTFLMVFLIQNTQNRDAKATHLKLDELIKSIDPARNSFIDVEDASDEELTRLEKQFKTFKNENKDRS